MVQIFERFTDRVRHTIVLCQEEARLLNHNYIGTEHLLLGLLREPDHLAGQALRALDISYDAVHAQVQALVTLGADPPHGHIPFTPRAKKVLELALREALGLGHNYIGTEHILLGLIREGEGVAAQILVKMGASLVEARTRVIDLLTIPTPTPEEEEPSPSTLSPQERKQLLQNLRERAMSPAVHDKPFTHLTWTIATDDTDMVSELFAAFLAECRSRGITVLSSIINIELPDDE